MKWMVAAALAGVVKAQSQCSADYLAQINTLCCTGDGGQDTCHGGEPTRCNGNCATMFLDFYDNCDTSGLPPSMDTLATTCRSTFHRCSARNPTCSPDATCTPLLDDLTCSKPPCMACVCGPGLMGDGLTCVERPQFQDTDVPAAIASGQCLPAQDDA